MLKPLNQEQSEHAIKQSQQPRIIKEVFTVTALQAMKLHTHFPLGCGHNYGMCSSRFEA